MTDIEQVREALRAVVASGANAFRNGGQWDDVPIARAAYDDAVAALAALDRMEADILEKLPEKKKRTAWDHGAPGINDDPMAAERLLYLAAMKEKPCTTR